MREELQKRNGRRGRFTATFARFGRKTAYKGPPLTTILLRNVKDESGQEVCDHVWFTMGLRFEAMDLKAGDQISFEARVRPYQKGYRGRREDDDLPCPSVDYRLAFPTKIRKLDAPAPQSMPLFA